MDEIPGTSSEVEETGLAPADVGQERSNEKDPVKLAEVTAVAPNTDGSITNEKYPRDSVVVEDGGLASTTGVAIVDTPTIVDTKIIHKTYAG